jgi:Short C-terminal domain/Phospholipase_D-nuclease N-terminal
MFAVIEAGQFGTGQVLVSMVYFFLFFIWIWLLVVVFGDIFRSDDLGGWGKALWTIFVILVPYLGVFVYLIARGHKMGAHAAKAAHAQDAAMQDYVRSVAASSGKGTADEVTRLADLRDRGVITDAEFQQGKAKALAG